LNTYFFDFAITFSNFYYLWVLCGSICTGTIEAFKNMWFVLWPQAMTFNCKVFAFISWMWPWSFDFEGFVERPSNHGFGGLI
jgi:hypothetical protein